jgi:2-amino-4-hydroxy-6-hydroxymethyldihydropteridine diphosphokinase
VSAPETVFVALGSNLGNSLDTISRAMLALQYLSDEPLLKSSFWRSAPVDCPPGSPHFINAMVGLQPRQGETPESLLRRLRAIEQEFGRAPKKIQNEARVIDLDLIAFGLRIVHSAELTLPHPRATMRRFVLQPMGEIAPDFVFPSQTKTVRQLLEILPKEELQRVAV